MKKIKNKKSGPIQIKTPQSQITTLWNSPISTQRCLWVFFLFCFLLSFSFSSPDRSLSFSASILSFSSLFLLLFLLSPSILVLSLLDFAQTQTQTHMPQAPFSNQWVSLFGIFFLWVSVHMVLPTCRGEVEGVGLWGSAWWRVWGLWWSASVVEFWWWHISEFGSVGDALHDCSVAGLKFDGGFQWLRLEFSGGFRWWHRSGFGGGIRSQIGVWSWVSFPDRRWMAPGLAEVFFFFN